MIYARLYESALTHPKVIKCSDAALVAWMKGFMYAAKHLTDGFLPSEAIKFCTKNVRVPAQLVRNGLWQKVEHGYVIHDYLEWNDSKKEVMRKHASRVSGGKARAAKAAAQAAARAQAPPAAPPQAAAQVSQSQSQSQSTILKREEGGKPPPDSPPPLDEFQERVRLVAKHIQSKPELRCIRRVDDAATKIAGNQSNNAKLATPIAWTYAAIDRLCDEVAGAATTDRDMPPAEIGRKLVRYASAPFEVKAKQATPEPTARPKPRKLTPDEYAVAKARAIEAERRDAALKRQGRELAGSNAGAIAALVGGIGGTPAHASVTRRKSRPDPAAVEQRSAKRQADAEAEQQRQRDALRELEEAG